MLLQHWDGPNSYYIHWHQSHAASPSLPCLGVVPIRPPISTGVMLGRCGSGIPYGSIYCENKIEIVMTRIHAGTHKSRQPPTTISNLSKEPYPSREMSAYPNCNVFSAESDLDAFFACCHLLPAPLPHSQASSSDQHGSSPLWPSPPTIPAAPSRCPAA